MTTSRRTAYLRPTTRPTVVGSRFDDQETKISWKIKWLAVQLYTAHTTQCDALSSLSCAPMLPCASACRAMIFDIIHAMQMHRNVHPEGKARTTAEHSHCGVPKAQSDGNFVSVSFSQALGDLLLGSRRPLRPGRRRRTSDADRGARTPDRTPDRYEWFAIYIYMYS